MPTPEQLQTFVKRIKFLVEKDGEQECIAKHNHLCKFKNSIANIRLQYQKVIEAYQRDIIPFLQSHSYLASDSVLSIIGKEYWETYHSKMLAQIWNCSQSEILCRFMHSIGADEIAHLITQSEYKVKTELPLTKSRNKTRNGKRIDILITDNKSWVIVIENKINARVSKHGREDSQLARYRKWVEEKFPAPQYKQCFILLSLRNNRCQCEEGWLYCDYLFLFQILLNCSYRDRLVEEYLTTLYSLLRLNIDIASCLCDIQRFEKIIAL